MDGWVALAGFSSERTRILESAGWDLCMKGSVSIWDRASKWFGLALLRLVSCFWLSFSAPLTALIVWGSCQDSWLYIEKARGDS